MVFLKEINEENFDQVIKMRLPQGAYCASNIYSLAQAWLYKDIARPYAIYNNDLLIGFIMFDIHYDKRELGIWRFMFAPEYQNKGYGYQTLKMIINTFDKEKFDYLYLSCAPQNDIAMHLYKKVGFYETGEIDDDEVVLRYDF